MEAGPSIVIHEQDPVIVQGIREVLSQYDLDNHVCFENGTETNPAYLFIGFAESPANSAVDRQIKLQKPVRAGALIEALQNLLATQEQQKPLQIGPFSYTAHDRMLRHENGDSHILTEREAHLLDVLHKAKGGIVPRAKLLQEVWGFRDDLDTHTVETHIYRLRQKVEKDPGKPRYIITEHNGYRLWF